MLLIAVSMLSSVTASHDAVSVTPSTAPVPEAPAMSLVVTAIVSPVLAPTWNEMVPAEPPVPSSSLMPLNSVFVADVRDLRGERRDLGHDGRLVVGGQRAVRVLHLQVTDALKHRVHLVEGTFCGLDERDAVLRVAVQPGQAADLSAHLL